MGEYNAYTDTNGIKWTIASSGRTMLATVLDDAEPRYIPAAEDLTQIIPTATEESSQAEVERTAFARLREQVDAYAAAHRQATGLSVKASATKGVPWWVWVGAAALLLKKRR